MAVSVCVTVDFDAISVWTGARGTRSPNLIARGEFGEIGAARLLDLFRDRALPTTWFVPGHTIDTYPAICQRVADDGHEIGYHGYCHEAPSSQRDEAEERQILAKAIDRVERLVGHAPVGHRLPGGNLGTRWIQLLLEHGFTYDSSMAPHDVRPTWVRTGDVARTDGAHVFGPAVDLVEIPFDWVLDDWPYFSHEPPRQAGLRSPDDVYGIWAAEFDYLAERLGEGVYVLTVHPQCIGRGSRLLMLERLLDHIAAHGDVAYRRMIEVADDFRRHASVP